MSGQYAIATVNAGQETGIDRHAKYEHIEENERELTVSRLNQTLAVTGQFPFLCWHESVCPFPLFLHFCCCYEGAVRFMRYQDVPY